jgi:hypothetical protein
MGKNGYTNGPVGTIRYDRATNTFQEWNGGAWVTLVIALSGGGLGAANPSDARNVLGIGTMGTQNANAVAITGGTISGLASLGVNGAIAAGGGISGQTVYSSMHMHAVGGIYVGNPPQLVILPSGLIDSTKISGLIPTANLGSGTANAGTALFGDGTWKAINMSAYKANQAIATTLTLAATGLTPTNYDIPLAGFTNFTKMFFVPASPMIQGAATEANSGYFTIPSPTILRYTVISYTGGAGRQFPVSGHVLEIL